MDILIAGRSLAAPHDITINTNTSVVINTIDYDGTTDMSTLPANFYDMVWCKGCAIYGPFNPGTDPRTRYLTLATFNAAWRVLKVGGIFVMPLSPTLIANSKLEKIKTKANDFIVGSSEHWSMESTEIEDMPVSVESTKPTEPTYKHALVFTKTMKGGSRRSRKTMRRRHRR
jgi:hypothetical protein